MHNSRYSKGLYSNGNLAIDLSNNAAAILKMRKIATVARKVANRRRLAYLSLAVIIAIVAILRTFQYGHGIIGRSLVLAEICFKLKSLVMRA